MKKELVLILVCVLSGCTSADVESTHIPIPSKAIQTPTLTPTLTPTPSPTSTARPSSTPEPTNSPVPIRDLSHLITADDVPEDFEMADGGPLFLGIVPVEETFAFYNRVVGEAFIGSAMLLHDQQDKENFDALVANKAAFLFFVLSQLESDLTPGGPLDVGEIGDISYAYSADEKEHENQFRWDALIFRRNDVGIIVAHLYLIDTAPILSLEEITTILDNHILANPEFGLENTIAPISDVYPGSPLIARKGSPMV
jgi:hypothetical protein